MIKSTALFHTVVSELSAADIELIENFVRGEKKTSTAVQLQVEYSKKVMKLLDRRGRLVAMTKQVNEWQQKVLLNNQVEGYMSLLCATLERHDFLATRKSRHPDFVEYSRYQTPEGYSLRYQPAHVMGLAWLERYAQPSEGKSHGLLVFQEGNWFPIRELKLGQRTLQLRTLVGETIIDGNDYVVWIEQSLTTGNKSSQPQESPVTSIDPDLAEETMYLPENSLGDITKEITDLQTATQFIITPTMAINPTSQSQTSETTIPDPVMKELMDAIKVKALKRLLDSVKNGETVTITEVLKNGQDQTITAKTTEIKRSCPRWIIERIRGSAEF